MPMGPPEAAKIVQNGCRQWHQALLVALAVDAQQQIGAIDRADLQGRGLTDAQTASIHEGKAGVVGRVPDAAQQVTDLHLRQDRQTTLLRGTDIFSPRTAATGGPASD